MRRQRNKTTLVLSVLAAGSFAVGLLGTVTSLMFVFNEMSEAEVIGAEDLSSSVMRSIMWSVVGFIVGAACLLALLIQGK